jgi:ferrous iron transport protein B
MIVAQGLNKIYLTIAQSIARFGRFFCVGLLRFNTCGLPLLLAVNMIDEAEQLGIQINRGHLEKQLGVPVVTMAAALNWGVKELKEKVCEYVKSGSLSGCH